MRERDFAGPGPLPAADQPRVRDGVVRRAEGPVAHEGHLPAQMPADTVDARHIERLGGRQAREDGGERAGEQRLAAAGRAGHDDIVPARRRDFQPALGVLLPAHFGEVGAAGILPNVGVDGRGRLRRDQFLADEMADEADERCDRIDRHARHERGLGGIVGGDDQRREAARLRRVGNRQHPINVAHAAVEREFPDDERGRDCLVRNVDLHGGEQDAEGNRQVVRRPLLADVRRGEIDGDAPGGEAAAAVADGGAHPLLRLLHGGVGQSDNIKGRHPRANIYLHRDRHAVQPDQGATGHFGEHPPLLPHTVVRGRAQDSAFSSRPHGGIGNCSLDRSRPTR